MKTESVNVTLPSELAEFVRQEIRLGAHANANEYLRELIRHRREARIEADVRFLENASVNAPTDEPPQSFFDDVAATQQRLRAAKKRPR